MTNLATDCLEKVAIIEIAIAPLVEKKEMELAKLQTVLRARLELWCEQFTDMATPMFDGERGFGFKGRFRDHIFSDECLVKFVIDGPIVKATFDPGLFEENIFTMRLPLRYLDSETGEAALLQDANDFKAQYQAEFKNAGPALS